MNAMLFPPHCQVHFTEERTVMVVEFTARNRTYQCAVAVPPGPPPARIQIPFRPCALRPPTMLELDWIATDDLRSVELYKPVMEQRRS